MRGYWSRKAVVIDWLPDEGPKVPLVMGLHHHLPVGLAPAVWSGLFLVFSDWQGQEFRITGILTYQFALSVQA